MKLKKIKKKKQQQQPGLTVLERNKSKLTNIHWTKRKSKNEIIYYTI